MNDPTNMLGYRVSQLEEGQKRLDKEKAEDKDMQAVVAEVRGLRRALIAFSLTVAGSAVLFAFTVAQILAGGH